MAGRPRWGSGEEADVASIRHGWKAKPEPFIMKEMPRSTRNRSGVPSEASLSGLSDAELEKEAARVASRLATPLSPLLSKLFLKKRHAIRAEQARRID